MGSNVWNGHRNYAVLLTEKLNYQQVNDNFLSHEIKIMSETILEKCTVLKKNQF